MRIAVIGAGIIGVTAAYELATDGHEVTVIERHSSVAEGASFANAGVVAPGYVTPLAAPGMPAKVLRGLLARHAPARVRRPLAAADIAWLRRWLAACDSARHATNRAHMQRLAFYSQQRLHAVADRLDYAFERSQGYLVLLRGDRELTLARPGLALLRDAGVTFHEITGAEARQIEPALNPNTPLAGAIYLPGDEVGNCRQFAVILRDAAERLGVRYVFDTTVAALGADPTPFFTVNGDATQHRCDAIVLCTGVDSPRLLAPLGLRLPLRPVYGYSISAHIPEPVFAPRSGVMDERYKVAITRMGQRVRVAGSAEIGGRLGDMNPRALTTLYKVLADWFPAAGRLWSGAQVWKGARPMLPDGPPIVGASGVPGVWLNLGHGSSGWALSCGSARVLADQIAGRTPEIDTQGLGLDRLR